MFIHLFFFYILNIIILYFLLRKWLLNKFFLLKLQLFINSLKTTITNLTFINILNVWQTIVFLILIWWCHYQYLFTSWRNKFWSVLLRRIFGLVIIFWKFISQYISFILCIIYLLLFAMLCCIIFFSIFIYLFYWFYLSLLLLLLLLRILFFIILLLILFNAFLIKLVSIIKKLF